MFQDNFQQTVESLEDIPNPYTIDEFLLTGELVLNKYMEEIAPTIQPLAVELEFELKLTKYPITIKGFIDLIDDTETIRDYKTVSKSTLRNWTQQAVNKNLQLTMYSAAYRKIYNKTEKQLAIDLLPRVSNPQFKSITTTRTYEDIHQVLSVATTIEKITNLGVFLPNLDKCTQCPLSSVCPKLPIIK